MDPQNPQTNPANDQAVHTEVEHKDASSNVESATEILKQGAVKAIIWEDIVAKGYDTMDFAKFLGDFQRDHNIAEGNWTQLKLKEAIGKFKETNSPQFSEQVLDVSSILSKASKQKGQDAEPVEAKKETEQPTVFEVESSDLEGRRKTFMGENGDIIKEKVFVKTAEPTLLNQHKDIKITIEDAHVEKGGVFGGDHIRFTIKTEPLGWNVQRKHKEFARLKLVLDKLHPGIVIPNILKKNEKEKFGDESNKKRIYVYERFLQECAQNEDIKATKFFVDFLSIADKNKFVPIKKAVEKVEKITRLDDLTSLSGEIPIDIRPELANHSILSETYFLQAEPVYREIKNLGKRLAGEFNQISTTINELSQHYATLHTISSNFNKKATAGKDKLEEVYAELTNITKNWGESFKTTASAVKKNIVCFYKYAIYESDALKGMNQARFRLQTEFEKLNKDLMEKKEKLWVKGDPNKWEADPVKLKAVPKEQLLANKQLSFDLMLAKESVPVKQFKDSYGFLNYATYKQLEKIFSNQYSNFGTNFTEFFQKHIDSLTSLHREWANLMTDLRPSKVELQAH